MLLWGGLFAVGMRSENEQRWSEATQTQSLTLRSRKTCMKQLTKDMKTVAMSGPIHGHGTIQSAARDVCYEQQGKSETVVGTRVEWTAVNVFHMSRDSTSNG